MALERWEEAIHKHHSLSVQATHTHVKMSCCMDHPSNPREGFNKDTFLILHTVRSYRAHKAAEMYL